VASLIDDAFDQIGRLFAENVELHMFVESLATEWAVQLEDGEVIGIYSTEAHAVFALAEFDQDHPDIPAFIVFRPVGQWVKS
jgi:hypothetical protein